MFGVEVGAYLYQTRTSLYGYSDIVTSDSSLSVDLSLSKRSVPPGTLLVGDYHVHVTTFATGHAHMAGVDGEEFLPQDKEKIFSNSQLYGSTYRGYLSTPSGMMLQYSPKTLNTGITDRLF